MDGFAHRHRNGRLIFDSIHVAVLSSCIFQNHANTGHWIDSGSLPLRVQMKLPWPLLTSEIVSIIAQAAWSSGILLIELALLLFWCLENLLVLPRVGSSDVGQSQKQK